MLRVKFPAGKHPPVEWPRAMSKQKQQQIPLTSGLSGKNLVL